MSDSIDVYDVYLEGTSIANHHVLVFLLESLPSPVSLQVTLWCLEPYVKHLSILEFYMDRPYGLHQEHANLAKDLT